MRSMTKCADEPLKCPVRAKLKCPNYPSEDEVREAEIGLSDDERTRTATHGGCESRQSSSWSWLTRELTESSREEIANERGAIYVCSLRPGSPMGTDRLVSM